MITSMQYFSEDMFYHIDKSCLSKYNLFNAYEINYICKDIHCRCSSEYIFSTIYTRPKLRRCFSTNLFPDSTFSSKLDRANYKQSLINESGDDLRQDKLLERFKKFCLRRTNFYFCVALNKYYADYTTTNKKTIDV